MKKTVLTFGQSRDWRSVIERTQRQQLGAVAPDVFAASVQLNRYASGTETWEEIMELGNFSVSLAVRDIQASKLFYEKLGFTAFPGDQSQNWVIMKNGDRNVGLFQGMFDKNILTFNRAGRTM